MTDRRRNRIVSNVIVLAALGAFLAFVLWNERPVTQVWRTDKGTTLRGEPGGALLDDYVLCPCSDPAGKRIDFVMRRPSALRTWLGHSSGAPLHRLDETNEVVEFGGERWHRFLVNENGLTAEQAVKSVSGE